MDVGICCQCPPNANKGAVCQFTFMRLLRGKGFLGYLHPRRCNLPSASSVLDLVGMESCQVPLTATFSCRLYRPPAVVCAVRARAFDRSSIANSSRRGKIRDHAKSVLPGRMPLAHAPVAEAAPRVREHSRRFTAICGVAVTRARDRNFKTIRAFYDYGPVWRFVASWTRPGDSLNSSSGAA